MLRDGRVLRWVGMGGWRTCDKLQRMWPLMRYWWEGGGEEWRRMEEERRRGAKIDVVPEDGARA